MSLTPEEVSRLNARQQDPRLHPLTCGNDRGDAAHKAYAAEHGGDWGQLVATSERWICPVHGCGYTQEYGMPRIGPVDPLLARIATLEATLKPFADYAAGIDGDAVSADYPDACPVTLRPGAWGEDDNPTLGDLRAAREALEGRH